MKCKGCKNSWIYCGIVVGFLGGFLYFAFEIYSHSHNRSHQSPSSTNSQYHSAGTTQ